MTPVVRAPTDDDRSQVIDVLRTSLNFTQSWADARGPTMPLSDYRCAYDGDRVVAVAAAYRFRQWFGGRDLGMSGIYAVATLPEHRATGLASAAVLQILREAHENDVPLTALYPAVLRPYRKLGYELAGTYSEHRLDLEDIPADLGSDLPEVTLLDVERDLIGIKNCYREWIRHHNGPLEPIDDTWWTKRILSPWGEAISRAVVVRGEGGVIEGFVALRHSPVEGGHLEIDFGLECLAFVATTDRALRALLTYFRAFRGVGVWVQWCGPAEDPIAMMLLDQKISTQFRYRWMLHLLDVPGALGGRGYPAIDEEAVIALEDPHFPENAGPWRLVVRDGVANVEPAPSVNVRPISVGILSSLFSGFLRVPDAVRLGYLDPGDPATGALERLFAGSDPWCPFFF
ncbi:MAG: GNAT family N-acetyltransferase [Actinomycetota bacterium]